MTHVLYRFYDIDRQLLYVGITNNPWQRIKAHESDKDWWNEVAHATFEHYQSRMELEAEERAAIKSERPRYNKTHVQPGPELETRVLQLEQQISELASLIKSHAGVRHMPMVMNATQLAAELGVNTTRLASLRKAGVGPPCHPKGNGWFYMRDEVIAHIEQYGISSILGLDPAELDDAA
jgi:predicted GIY-YIG superfamily endonuclease